MNGNCPGDYLWVDVVNFAALAADGSRTVIAVRRAILGRFSTGHAEANNLIQGYLPGCLIRWQSQSSTVYY